MRQQNDFGASLGEVGNGREDGPNAGVVSDLWSRRCVRHGDVQIDAHKRALA
jgi:hypothetical protein